MKKIHVFDLETGSLDTQAVIFSVGIASFTLGDGRAYPDISVVEYRLQVTPQLLKGRVIDDATLNNFWLNESKMPKVVRDRSIPPGLKNFNEMEQGGEFEDAMSPEQFFIAMSEIISNSDIVIGNGPEFDVALISSYYESFKAIGHVRKPWDHRRVHSYRTLKLLMKPFMANEQHINRDNAIDYLGKESLLIDGELYLHVASHDAVVEALKIIDLFTIHKGVYVLVVGNENYNLDNV